MIDAQVYSPSGILDKEVVYQTLTQGLGGKFRGMKVLALIPDHTRSLPLPMLFKMVVEILRDVKQLDFLVALGTHPPLSETALLDLVGITPQERTDQYQHVGLFNHAWDDPSMLTTLGILEKDEIKQLAGQFWHDSMPETVPIRINKLALAYDHLLILGPTFPHEVVGYSGGAKYLFPGISGPEMIHASHWLGALATVRGTIGFKDTPVRAMIHAAAQRLQTPITLVALIVDGHDLAGLYIGDIYSAWEAAADTSAQRHVIWVDQPYKRVLACAPKMYDELWTAAKATYKVEPAVALGGEVIIYAPHLDTISQVHGKYIYEVGYHILPYFLDHWQAFKHIPLGVLAHSTHVRGSGRMIEGSEQPNITVTLASQISPADCECLNLGYRDPTSIVVEDWVGREDEGILLIPRAGEMLYRLRES
jgi:nickel-dependent lactate racemase